MDMPLPLEGAPRLTRSAAKAAQPLRSQSDSAMQAVSLHREEAVKEKKKKQLPLHRALQKAADLNKGVCVCVVCVVCVCVCVVCVCVVCVCGVCVWGVCVGCV